MTKKTNSEDPNENVSPDSESELKNRTAGSNKSQLGPSPEEKKSPSKKYKDTQLTNFSAQKPLERPKDPLPEGHLPPQPSRKRVVILEEIDTPFIEALPPNFQRFFKIIVHRVRPQQRGKNLDEQHG